MINKVKAWKANQVTAKQRFVQLWMGCTQSSFKSLNEYSVIYRRGENILFIKDIDTGLFWCSNKYVWSIFEEEYKMNFEEVSDMIKDILKITHVRRMID